LGGVPNLVDCIVAPGALCFRSAYEQGAFYEAGSAPTFTSGPQQDHRLEVHTYYVSPNTTGADGIPSLHRVVLNAAGVMTDELVVSGVQSFQVQYGVASTVTVGGVPTVNTQYFDANNVNPAAVQTAAGARVDSVGVSVDAIGNSVNPWGDVVSVRLWLLMRNNEADKGNYTDTNSYTIGDQVVPAANDKYRRQIFTSTLQLRN
jgi:hypothetical protein